MNRAATIIMPAETPLMDAKKSHAWSPITDLPADWQALVDPALVDLAQRWVKESQAIREHALLRDFVARLCRQYAIETGAIEEIYHISRNATMVLIDRGIDAALLSHGDTEEPADLVVARIEDQHRAIMGVYQFVASQRRLTKSFLLELHQVLTENQQTLMGRDSLGQWVERELPRGRWKPWPNNVGGPGGFHYEFCPPVQVDSEIDQLLAWYESHAEAGVSPIVESAWLHHRFVQIHPFADGNGRSARCLASMVLVKAGWLPIVVTRDDKPAYFLALQAADDGDLRPLVKLFSLLQSIALRQALRVAAEIQGKPADL